MRKKFHTTVANIFLVCTLLAVFSCSVLMAINTRKISFQSSTDNNGFEIAGTITGEYQVKLNFITVHMEKAVLKLLPSIGERRLRYINVSLATSTHNGAAWNTIANSNKENIELIIHPGEEFSLGSKTFQIPLQKLITVERQDHTIFPLFNIDECWLVFTIMSTDLDGSDESYIYIHTDGWD